METLRLRKIQQPSEVERLLESYISRANILPASAYPIRDTRAIPNELRGWVAKALKQGNAWSCWASNSRTWLFTAEMSIALSRERGTPVLQVNRYLDDGVLEESANLMLDKTGKWSRCAE
jgi:hypothetical protein